MKLDMQEQSLSSPVHPVFLSSYPGVSSPLGLGIYLHKIQGVDFGVPSAPWLTT